MKCLLLCVALLVSCATDLYGKDFVMVQGNLLTYPILDKENKRLMFYIDNYEGDKLIAIAENKENFKLLKGLSHTIGLSPKTIFLFCKKADSSWREYADDSVDYEVFGVGYYNFYADRYVTIVTTYGDSIGDILKSTDWKRFVTEVTKKVAKSI